MEPEVQTRQSGRRGRRRFNGIASPGAIRKYQILILTVLSIFLIGTAGVVLMKSAPVSEDRLRAEAVAAAHVAVRRAVVGDLQTAFANLEETDVKFEPGDRYRVRAWVDLIPESGQTERDVFSCVLHRESAGNWTSEDVSVIPQ